MNIAVGYSDVEWDAAWVFEVRRNFLPRMDAEERGSERKKHGKTMIREKETWENK